MEGDAVSALITAGVVVISAIGDYYLVKDIVGATKFTFSQNARSRLAAMPDTENSAASRIKVSGYLDDLAAKGGIKSGLTQAQIDYIVNIAKGNRPNPSSYLSQVYKCTFSTI